jgi:hypothetical protein
VGFVRESELQRISQRYNQDYIKNYNIPRFQSVGDKVQGKGKPHGIMPCSSTPDIGISLTSRSIEHK